MAKTVKQFAEENRMGVSTVLDLIHSGDLPAYNVGRKVGGKPQWRISEEDEAAFKESRRSTAPVKQVKRKRTRRSDNEVTEYFK